MGNKKNINKLIEKSCNSRALNLRVHFKNTRETSVALKGMSLRRAQQFLKNVISKLEIVPFTRFKYGVSRKSQLKTLKISTTGRWPQKSAVILLEILKNAESNAKQKGLDLNSLFIDKVDVNRAVKGRRRTFRAHGRINNFNSNPCHINISLINRNKSIPKCYTVNN